MPENNLLIEASAGTGKTFSLATRFIRLLADGTVRPDQIIALTFSRAATREIFSKLALRLAAAASDDKTAAEESGRIGRTLQRSDFAEILAKVIDFQHVGTISTLDSFILRIIRYFPLEMGFQGNVDILGDYDSREARRKACAFYMKSKESKEDFINAFREIQGETAARSFADRLDSSVAHWMEFIAETPDAAKWDAESMMAAAGVIPSRLRHIGSAEDLLSYQTATPEERETFREFIDFYANLSPAAPIVPGKGISKKIAEGILSGKTGEKVEFNRKTYTIRKELAKAMSDDIENACLARMIARFRQMAGTLKTVAMIAERYNETTRKYGRLTFNDLPRVISSHSSLDVENLQYRFDERFDHWAIDEFQDTSRAQWNCISNLVDEAASGDAGRSVTIVGDLKQAIYGWRGGDESIFSELAARKSQFGAPAVLAESHRYGQETVNLINSVFCSENIEKTISEKRDAAIRKWLDPNSWMEHRIPKYRNTRDYVCILGADSDKAAKSEDGISVTDRTVNLVRDLWNRRKRNGLTDKTLAVLVRNNTEGRDIADKLRKQNVPAVFEGENSDANHPVVALFLNLLHFADHPSDTYDYGAICASPLSMLFRENGATRTAASISAEISAKISHLGLSRTLRSYIERCRDAKIELDDYSKVALERLIQYATEYEARGEAENCVGGFLDYFEAVKTRDTSNPKYVTVITIHRSKGLGYDWVVVPLKETGQTFEGISTRDSIPGDGWILKYVPEHECGFFPRIMKRRAEISDTSLLANLHTYYVALSRNKEGLWIVLENKKPTGKSNSIHFRDLIFNAIGFVPDGDNSKPVFESKSAPDPSTVARDGGSAEKPDAEKGEHGFAYPAKENRITRHAPSAQPHAAGITRKASVLFDSGFGSAAEHGTELHKALSAIEWLKEDGTQPDGIDKSDIDLTVGSEFRSALLKSPDNSGLWREKSFELLIGGEWYSGIFDRVAFSTENGMKSAVVYDYKTNAMRRDETQEEYESRMVDEYRDQMATYKTALSSITGIPKERIATKLLLTQTMTAKNTDAR